MGKSVILNPQNRSLRIQFIETTKNDSIIFQNFSQIFAVKQEKSRKKTFLVVSVVYSRLFCHFSRFQSFFKKGPNSRNDQSRLKHQGQPSISISLVETVFTVIVLLYNLNNITSFQMIRFLQIFVVLVIYLSLIENAILRNL